MARNLLLAIRQLVAAARAGGTAEPQFETLSALRVTSMDMAPTGPVVRGYAMLSVLNPIWVRAVSQLLPKLTKDTAYIRFVEELRRQAEPGDFQLDHPLHRLITQVLAAEDSDEDLVLEQLVASALRKPRLLHCDIDVIGLAVSVPSFEIVFEGSRVRFRQMTIEDYQEPHSHHRAFHLTRFMPPPGSIIRIELEGVAPSDLQTVERKILVLLRLIRTWRVSFGQRKYSAWGPSPAVGETMGTAHNNSAPVIFGPTTVLSGAAASSVERFFNFVGPKLGAIQGKDAEVALTIAHERYEEALFAPQPERRIAICVMGMEALFFGEDETSELAYRLALRVSKVVSKSGVDAGVVQTFMKVGYHIRSVFVHGAYLSEKERVKCERKTGLPLPEFADRLLDYLRMTLLLLIRTDLNKADFLTTIEKSLVERSVDDELTAIVDSECSILLASLDS